MKKDDKDTDFIAPIHHIKVYYAFINVVKIIFCFVKHFIYLDTE